MPHDLPVGCVFCSRACGPCLPLAVLLSRAWVALCLGCGPIFLAVAFPAVAVVLFGCDI